MHMYTRARSLFLLHLGTPGKGGGSRRATSWNSRAQVRAAALNARPSHGLGPTPKSNRGPATHDHHRWLQVQPGAPKQGIAKPNATGVCARTTGLSPAQARVTRPHHDRCTRRPEPSTHASWAQQENQSGTAGTMLRSTLTDNRNRKGTAGREPTMTPPHGADTENPGQRSPAKAGSLRV